MCVCVFHIYSVRYSVSTAIYSIDFVELLKMLTKSLSVLCMCVCVCVCECVIYRVLLLGSNGLNNLWCFKLCICFVHVGYVGLG